VPRDAAALAELPDTDPTLADLPHAEQRLDDFEQRFCYDRFWAGAGAAPHTRYLCSGLSLVVVGDDVVSDERMPAWRKVSAFFAVRGRRRD